MIIPPHIQQKFSDVEPYFDILRDNLRSTLLTYCERNGFAFTYRVKSLDSLTEKIETGRYKRWTDIDDLIACTIIIPTLRYEDEVLTFLDNTFSRINVKKRGGTLKSPEVFRFDSTRFIGKLSPIEGDGSSLIRDIKFEVQIRTAFEHAWTVTTHSLTYKSEVIDWKRYRLTAQLKAVVEQMDMLVTGFDQASKNISEHNWPEIEMKGQITERFKLAFKDGLIKSELEPKDWTRFSDNVYNMIASTTEAKHKTPNEENKYIRKGLDFFFEEIKKIDPSKIPLSISLIQLIFGTLNECGFLTPPLNNYNPIITEELLILYPSVKKHTDYFIFDDFKPC
ncbi:MAG: RelA/SpoT domain-containing protein [Methanothrix sp.]|jgi:ppGpp synthetase/RelA/SpoT-type nucleotidyltranferase|nr:RelA/SpoT domain-containing protein [Methanothrix sp.]